MSQEQQDLYLHFSVSQIYPNALARQVDEKMSLIKSVPGGKNFPIAVPGIREQVRTVDAGANVGLIVSAGIAAVMLLSAEYAEALMVVELGVLSYVIIKLMGALAVDLVFNKAVNKHFGKE